MRRLAAICAEQLVERAGRDDRIWVLDGDLADSYGVTEFASSNPSRFVMAGIAEQNMVSMAAGMAVCGARPFVFSFASFLAFRAADQVRVALAQSGLPVTLVASHAGGCSGRNGRSHCAVTDVAVMASMPGLDVWAPADRGDVTIALDAVLRRGRPAYLRMPRTELPELPGDPSCLRRIGEGGEVVLLANGLASHWALESRETLKERGIEVDVVSVLRLAPPPDELEAVAASASKLVVIEDHVRLGGLADIVGRLTGRQPDAWFGWRDWPPGGDEQWVRERAGLDAETLARGIAEVAGR